MSDTKLCTNIITVPLIGDFHFLWECLRVVYFIFWGTPSLIGSLCNLREIVRQVQVDKGVKVFNIGDEFLVHAFKSHLTAGIMTQLNIQTTADDIEHAKSAEWLKKTAETLVLMPTTARDQIHQFHKCFLHMAFLYVDLREAIRWEDVPHITKHWKFWLTRFLGTGRKNYTSESVHLIANLTANFPHHIAYILTHNRTANTRGIPGRGKPLDQLIEHYNL